MAAKPEQLAAYLDQVRAVIAEHGWMVQGVVPVEGGDPAVPFSYTIGMTDAGLPELVIAGLPAQVACTILNAAARQHLAAEIRPGDVVDTVASVPFRVVDAPAAEVQMARNLYGDRVRALQLVWPDVAGAFPGEAGWSLGNAQPIYDGLPR